MRFTKMQGCGNDYVFVDGEREEIPKELRGDLARRISDRHYGVGSDGLIFILPGRQAPFEMEMYNADGSRAEMCGNGIRCVAKYVYDKGKTRERTFDIESAGQVRRVELLDPELADLGESAEGERSRPVRVNMGRPVLGAETVVYSKQLFRVSMGNPHAVILLKESDPWCVEKEGPLLESAPCFPDRTNVEFVKVEDRENVRMRVWERGAGETFACGSGACAAAAVCMQKGLTDRKITVKLLGGELRIAWEREDGDMFLTGPAVTVYEGRYPDTAFRKAEKACICDCAGSKAPDQPAATGYSEKQ